MGRSAHRDWPRRVPLESGASAHIGRLSLHVFSRSFIVPALRDTLGLSDCILVSDEQGMPVQPLNPTIGHNSHAHRGPNLDIKASILSRVKR